MNVLHNAFFDGSYVALAGMPCNRASAHLGFSVLQQPPRAAGPDDRQSKHRLTEAEPM